jgi:hypothetical protein
VHVVKTSPGAWDTPLTPVPVVDIEPAMRTLEEEAQAASTAAPVAAR